MNIFPGGEGVQAYASRYWEKGDFTINDSKDKLNKKGSWNAGAHAPQWLEVDLGSEYPITLIS